jgi:hypothetical protein
MIETTNVEILSSANHIVSLESGAIVDYTLLFPPNTGSNGQVLTTDGTGVLTWTNGLTGGTVTSVGLSATSTIFSVSGSPVTGAGTLALSYNGVALPVANGGTGLTSVGSNGQLLTVVAGVPAWTAPAANGTVTSVSASTPSVFSVSVSNPTTTPSIVMSYSGTALPVANGGTGVTVSSGANSVMLRDTNQNVSMANTIRGTQTVVSSGGSTSMTVATPYNVLVTGSTFHTLVLPDATLLAISFNYLINNNSSGGGVVIKNNGGTTLTSIPVGGLVYTILLDNSTSNGAWDYHFQAPSNVSWGTSSFSTSSNLQTSNQLVSTVATGTAPLSVASTTNVTNLNASSLNGATFAIPGTIGGTTPGIGNFSVVNVLNSGTGIINDFIFGHDTGSLNAMALEFNYVGASNTGNQAIFQWYGSANNNPIITQEYFQAYRFVSTVTTGTAPITVTSTTVCPNLHAANSDALGGATFSAPGTIGGTTPGIVNATTVNSSSLTASQAVATDGSNNLVSVANTGSGSNVLATSPTLVTPVIGAATGTSLTLSASILSGGANVYGLKLTSNQSITGGSPQYPMSNFVNDTTITNNPNSWITFTGGNFVNNTGRTATFLVSYSIVWVTPSADIEAWIEIGSNVRQYGYSRNTGATNATVNTGSCILTIASANTCTLGLFVGSTASIYGASIGPTLIQITLLN